MEHTYIITGMSCDGCRSKVEKTLNAIEGIEANVSLQPPIATLKMEKHFPIAQLQDALSAAGKYTITINNSESPSIDKPETKSCCGSKKQDAIENVIFAEDARGKYYCPMHCKAKKYMINLEVVRFVE